MATRARARSLAPRSVGSFLTLATLLTLAALLVRRARMDPAPDGSRITPAYPVILNCLAVLVAGIASDTFRTPMIWVALGLACAVLRRPTGWLSGGPVCRASG